MASVASGQVQAGRCGAGECGMLYLVTWRYPLPSITLQHNIHQPGPSQSKYPLETPQDPEQHLTNLAHRTPHIHISISPNPLDPSISVISPSVDCSAGDSSVLIIHTWSQGGGSLVTQSHMGHRGTDKNIKSVSLRTSLN